MIARTHRSIQRRLDVHQRASSDAERSARARDCLGRRSGGWSVGDNFLPVANSPRTRWVGWRPRLKNGSRPVCPAVSTTPNEATVISSDILIRSVTPHPVTERSRPAVAGHQRPHSPTPHPYRRCGPRNTSLRCHAANSARTGASPACGPTRGAPLTRRKRAPHSLPPRNSRDTRTL
jgi:hypothetical protein